MPSQKNLLSLQGHLNSFDPNFLETSRLEEEVVPLTEGQMPKRKSDLETPRPPQDSLLCDMGGGALVHPAEAQGESVGFSAQTLTDIH